MVSTSCEEDEPGDDARRRFPAERTRAYRQCNQARQMRAQGGLFMAQGAVFDLDTKATVCPCCARTRAYVEAAARAVGEPGREVGFQRLVRDWAKDMGRSGGLMGREWEWARAISAHKVFRKRN